MLVVLALPSGRALLAPSPPREPARRETVGGAWTRASERVEPLLRQDEFDRVNIGARGRINATRDAARAGESWPGVVDRTLSSW